MPMGKDYLQSLALFVLFSFIVFLSIHFPFITENQLQVPNKLMEHGTNGTTSSCHQEQLGLNEEGMTLLVNHSNSKALMVKIKQ